MRVLSTAQLTCSCCRYCKKVGLNLPAEAMQWYSVSTTTVHLLRLGDLNWVSCPNLCQKACSSTLSLAHSNHAFVAVSVAGWWVPLQIFFCTLQTSASLCSLLVTCHACCLHVNASCIALLPKCISICEAWDAVGHNALLKKMSPEHDVTVTWPSEPVSGVHLCGPSIGRDWGFLIHHFNASGPSCTNTSLASLCIAHRSGAFMLWLGLWSVSMVQLILRHLSRPVMTQNGVQYNTATVLDCGWQKGRLLRQCQVTFYQALQTSVSLGTCIWDPIYQGKPKVSYHSENWLQELKYDSRLLYMILVGK